MRHRVAGRHFNRDTNQRKALLRNLLCALIEHGEMVTTSPKAKELKRLADKLIYKAQDSSVASRRLLHRYFGRRDMVNTLVERIAPAMSDRTSGYTTTSKVANRRGDNVSMVKIALVTKPEIMDTFKSGKEFEAPVAKPAKKAAPKAAKAETKPEVKAEETTVEKKAAVKKPAAKKTVKKAEK